MKEPNQHLRPTDGHVVRGGVAGLSITFSELGEVALVAVREMSLIDSTVIDEPKQGETGATDDPDDPQPVRGN